MMKMRALNSKQSSFFHVTWKFRLNLWLAQRFFLLFIQDADILWFRNPFDHFANNTDFQISSDKYRGNPYSFYNRPNCGYQYTRSNNRTIAMYRHWCQGGEENPSIDEQSVLKVMLKRNEIATYNVKIRFLETERFSGFCEVLSINSFLFILIKQC